MANKTLTRGEILQMVVFDLGYIQPDDATKDRLMIDIDAAERFLQETGIAVSIDDGVEVNDAQILAMYAAYLFERRRMPDNPMPRMLQWHIHNRLLAQKMKETE